MNLKPTNKSLPAKAVNQTQFKYGFLDFLHTTTKLLVIIVLATFALLPSGETNAEFYTESDFQGSVFSTSCWVAPVAPELVSLPNGQILNLGDPWLSHPLMDWNESAINCPTGEVEYKLQVSDTETFANLIYETGNWIPDTEDELSSLPDDGTYYWRVAARDGNHTGIAPIFSEVRQFTINTETILAPINLGWNLETQSATPDEMPLDLVCDDITNGGDPNNPKIAHNWTKIDGENLVYQREITHPHNNVAKTIYYETNNYTQFLNFEPPLPHIEGLWKFRVRAFKDTNNNGIYNNGEIVSPWSNYCNLTLDKDYQPPILASLMAQPQTPSLKLTKQDANKLTVAIHNAESYEKAVVIVTYLRDGQGNKVQEYLSTQVDNISDNPQIVPDIYLGSTSSGLNYIHYYPHTGIEEVHVQVDLITLGEPTVSIETDFEGVW